MYVFVCLGCECVHLQEYMCESECVVCGRERDCECVLCDLFICSSVNLSFVLCCVVLACPYPP